MPYIIDGHNLIATLPDIQLSDPDDEQRLIAQLQTFFSRLGKAATLYFDRRAPGEQKERRIGKLQVRFTTPPITADDAILKHLHHLRGRAKNYTVVSSDRQIQDAARRAGARVLASHEFARQLFSKQTDFSEGEKDEKILSEREIEQWELLFQRSRHKKE